MLILKFNPRGDVNMEDIKRFKIKQGIENEYHLEYDGKSLIKCNTKEEAQALIQLKHTLNDFVVNKEIECRTYQLLVEFYQKLIFDTLNDKLSEIDNMYAMKLMMEEICGQLDKLADRLSKMKDEDGVDNGGCAEDKGLD